VDNTIIVVISDNGASGEGGPNGSVNEKQVLQRLHRQPSKRGMRFYDHPSADPDTYNHYPIGWGDGVHTP